MNHDIIAIVTPIGNEAATIDKTYKELMKVNWNFWITIIDSFCKDGSDIILKKLAQNDKRIIVLDIGRGNGVAKAYIEGIKHAIKINATKIIETDIGHPIYLIPEFIKYLDEVPFVVGTRFNGGKFINVPFKRKLLSKLGTMISHLVLQLPFSDCTSGFQGFTKEIAESIPFDKFKSTGHFYQTEFKFYTVN